MFCLFSYQPQGYKVQKTDFDGKEALIAYYLSFLNLLPFKCNLNAAIACCYMPLAMLCLLFW